MTRFTAITDKQRAEVYKKFINNPSVEFTDTEKMKVKAFFTNTMNRSDPMHTDHSSTDNAYEYSYTADGIPVSSIPHAYARPVAEDQPQVIHHHHHSGIPWWLLLLNNNNNRTNNVNQTAPDVTNSGSKKDNHPDFGAWVMMLVIAGITIGPAIAGAFYLASEVGQNLERLYYNEGYIQAGLGMANIAFSLCLSAVLTNAVLSTAISALALSAGFANPVGWAFLIMGCVTLLTAACMHWVIQEGIYKANTYFNQDALNPEDPDRFTVTDEDVKNIVRKDRKGMKGLDGDNMQNIVTAIHHDMVIDPSRMTRYFRYSPFFRDAETAEKLNAIRTLRSTGKVNYKTEIVTDAGEEKTMNFVM